MLLDQPDLYEMLNGVWDAFTKLDRSRQIGFNGPQPIQLAEIVAYTVLNPVEDTDEFVNYVQIMDNEFLLDFKERQDKEKPK